MISQYVLAALYHTSTIICLKIIIKDKEKSLSDLFLYLLIITSGVAVVRVTSIFTLGSVTVLFLLMVFLYFKKCYLARKAICLSSIIQITAMISINISALLLYLIFPRFFGFAYDVLSPLVIVYYLATHFLFPVLIALLLVKSTVHIREQINENSNLHIALIGMLVMLHLTFYNLTAIINQQSTNSQTLQIWLVVFLTIFVTIFLGSFIFYTKAIESRHQIQRKEDEQQSLLYYTTEIEKQAREMRKFKHDYQNILSSFEDFIYEGDLAGLKSYFNDTVQNASKRIMQESFALEGLSRIKIKEIKSILVSKLMSAQDKGIVVRFEARQDIDDIQMNTVALVRMLGIILDNAIEELEEIKDYTPNANIIIGIWKEEDADEVGLVIQNTCRSELPRLHELKKEGFSSKGEGRGLGLSNLLEIVDSQPNVFLQTSVSDNQFIQKILIGGHL